MIMPNEPISSQEQPPPSGEVIIVWRRDGKKEQVTIREGVAYLWRYKDTDDIFSNVEDIVKWRGCNGFDF